MAALEQTKRHKIRSPPARVEASGRANVENDYLTPAQGLYLK